MTDEAVRQILTAPIVLLRPANEKERELFSDKKGWLYTFELKSGQSFVACLPKGEDVFTFRPLHNLVPQLVEFQWEKRNTFGVFPPVDTFCEMIPGTSNQEKEFFCSSLAEIVCC